MPPIWRYITKGEVMLLQLNSQTAMLLDKNEGQLRPMLRDAKKLQLDFNFEYFDPTDRLDYILSRLEEGSFECIEIDGDYHSAFISLSTEILQLLRSQSKTLKELCIGKSHDKSPKRLPLSAFEMILNQVEVKTLSIRVDFFLENTKLIQNSIKSAETCLKENTCIEKFCIEFKDEELGKRQQNYRNRFFSEKFVSVFIQKMKKLESLTLVNFIHFWDSTEIKENIFGFNRPPTFSSLSIVRCGDIANVYELLYLFEKYHLNIQHLKIWGMPLGVNLETDIAKLCDRTSLCIDVPPDEFPFHLMFQVIRSKKLVKFQHTGRDVFSRNSTGVWNESVDKFNEAYLKEYVNILCEILSKFPKTLVEIIANLSFQGREKKTKCYYGSGISDIE